MPQTPTKASPKKVRVTAPVEGSIQNFLDLNSAAQRVPWDTPSVVLTTTGLCVADLTCFMACIFMACIFWKVLREGNTRMPCATRATPRCVKWVVASGRAETATPSTSKRQVRTTCRIKAGEGCKVLCVCCRASDD